MNETENAKQKSIFGNLKFIFIIVGIFIFVLISILIMFYVYTRSLPKSIENTQSLIQDSVETVGELLPTFKKEESVAIEEFQTVKEKMEAISKSSLQNLGLDIKVKNVEEKEVLAYVFYLKKYFTRDIVKLDQKYCSKNLYPETNKEKKTENVLNIQNTMRGIEGLEKMSTSSVLDEDTRGLVYLFQKQYFNQIYKGTKTTEPTRVFDKETVTFLNRLCLFEKDIVVAELPNVRYYVKDTGEIIDYNIESKEKLTMNSYFVKNADEVIFDPLGNFVFIRNIENDVVKTRLVFVKTELVYDLENDIKEIRTIGGDRVVYTVKDKNTTQVKIYDLQSKKWSLAAVLPMTEYTFDFVDKNLLRFTPKPTAYDNGFSLLLNLQTKNLSNETGNVLGLTFKQTENKNYVLLGEGGLGNQRLLMLNTKSKSVGLLGIKTLPEKCAPQIFSEGLVCAAPKRFNELLYYPDDYYKGMKLGNDDLVYRSLTSTSTKIISTFDGLDVSLKNLEITPAGIFFISDYDNSLSYLEM